MYMHILFEQIYMCIYTYTFCHEFKKWFWEDVALLKNPITLHKDNLHIFDHPLSSSCSLSSCYEFRFFSLSLVPLFRFLPHPNSPKNIFKFLHPHSWGAESNMNGERKEKKLLEAIKCINELNMWLHMNQSYITNGIGCKLVPTNC